MVSAKMAGETETVIVDSFGGVSKAIDVYEVRRQKAKFVKSARTKDFGSDGTL